MKALQPDAILSNADWPKDKPDDMASYARALNIHPIEQGRKFAPEDLFSDKDASSESTHQA